MKPIKNQQLSIRIDESLKDRIEKRADEEGRGISNFVIYIVTNYLDKIDEAKKLIEPK